MIKSMLLAVILFFVSLVVVKAQASGGEASGGEAISEGQFGEQAEVVNGWNFFHVTNCYTDGTTFFVFPAEPTVDFISTNNQILTATRDQEHILLINSPESALPHLCH